MPSFAASWESLLVFAVIVVLSGLSNWLKQRQARRQEDEARQSRPAAGGRQDAPPLLHPPQGPEDTDWERQLRRLFGEEEPELPPSRPVPAPSPLETQPLPPLAAPDRVVVPPDREPPPELVYEPVVSTHGTSEPSLASADALAEEGEFIRVPWTESMAVPHGISPIEGKTVAHIRGESPIHGHGVLPAQSQRRVASPEVARVKAQLRQPRTAREVILATVVLGPPRALEGHTWPVSSVPATCAR